MKGEKKCLNDMEHVIGDEKYEWVRLNVLIRWLRVNVLIRWLRVGSIYWVNLRGLVF